ncbi:MAG: PAN domain-containing protein [Xanthobacteraceae bacterium]
MHHRILPLAIYLAVIGSTAVGNDAFGQTQPFRPTYEDGMDRRGQDYRSFHPIGPSALYCQQACLAESQCRAWSYASPSVRRDKQPTCWLKSSVPPPTQARGIVSGVVRPESTDVAAAAEGAKTAAPATAAPNAPAASGTQGLAAAAAAAKVLNLTRSAASGVESPLADSVRLDRDCNSVPSSVTITRKPTNGTAWVIEASYPMPASTLATGNTGKCAGRSVTGHKIMYRSNEGFHGTDTVVYDSTGAGMLINTTITITVP